MNKKLFIAAIAVSGIYAGLSLPGLTGISSPSGGLAYRLIIISVLLFSCIRTFLEFRKCGDHGALLSGALGLGTLAINEVYIFCYLILFNLGWQWLDMGVSLYPMAYLFIGFSLLGLKKEVALNG